MSHDEIPEQILHSWRSGWLVDLWHRLSFNERALIVAASEAEVTQSKNLETEGRNWGPVVRRYLALLGIRRPEPWCAAFVAYCCWVAGARLTPYMAAARWWLSGEPCEPVRGALGGWVLPSGKGHVFFVTQVHRVLGATWVHTIEGNTNEEGSREGNRILRRKRLVTKKMRFVDPEATLKRRALLGSDME